MNQLDIALESSSGIPLRCSVNAFSSRAVDVGSLVGAAGPVVEDADQEAGLVGYIEVLA